MHLEAVATEAWKLPYNIRTMSSSSTTSPEEEDSTPTIAEPTSSLAILLAQHDETHSIKEPARKSSNTIFLEKLVARLIGYIAAHDFSNPELQEYLTDDYTAFLEYIGEHPLLEGREAFLEHYRGFAAEHPEYMLEVESVVADVNEKNGTATVWSLLSVTGEPKGLRRQSVTVHWFRRKGGKWRAHKQTGVRGLAAYL